MNRLLALHFGFLLLMHSAFAAAQTTADEAAIRQLEIDFDTAWNRHDASALASQLVEDSDFITVRGVWTKSRSEFEKLQEHLQQTQFKDSVRTTKEVKIRFLTPEIAVVVVRATISGDRDPDGTLRTPRDDLGTQVLQKREGRWQKVQVQNTNVFVPAVK